MHALTSNKDMHVSISNKCLSYMPTHRAQKEEKLESSLAKLQATWSAITWQTTAAGSRGIPTVKLSDTDVEVLEDNQVLVQVCGAACLVCNFVVVIVIIIVISLLLV